MTEQGSEQPTRLTWLAWVGLAFVVVVTIGVALHATPYGSPDEAANALMVHQVATAGRALVVSPLTSGQLQLFHPRSVLIHGTQLQLGSFLGLVQVAGTASRWFGDTAGRLVVPLLSIAALTAFYGLLRRFWSQGWALTGAALLAVNPVWFQFQTLPMFHNGAFASMLIVAGYCLRRQFERPSWRWATAVGLTYGVALFFRPSEILWTGPLIAIVLLTMPGRGKWFPLVVGLTALVQVPWLIGGQHLYGSALSTGYTPDGAVSNAGASSTVISLWRLITPAGGWSLHFLSSAWWYYLLLLPASSAMALVALAKYIRRKFVHWQKVLKLTVVGIFALFPLVYYGSWDLYPLLPASQVGSLSSYDRYWIILFVAMIPGVVLTIRRIWHIHRLMAGCIFGLLLLGQMGMIIWHPGSGLRVRWQRQHQAESLRQAVVTGTPRSALIIAGPADKYLLADRLVGYALPATSAQWQTLSTLVTARPVYLLRSAAGTSYDSIAQLLVAHGLRLGSTQSVPGDELWLITSRT